MTVRAEALFRRVFVKLPLLKHTVEMRIEFTLSESKALLNCNLTFRVSSPWANC